RGSSLLTLKGEFPVEIIPDRERHSARNQRAFAGGGGRTVPRQLGRLPQQVVGDGNRRRAVHQKLSLLIDMCDCGSGLFTHLPLFAGKILPQTPDDPFVAGVMEPFSAPGDDWTRRAFHLRVVRGKM